MWLEAMYASMSVSGVCGAVLAINALFPAETRRFLRIVRAEIGSRVPLRRKRITLEVALHTQAEVDLKWWDEEFAKLERAIPGRDWARMVNEQIRAADEQIQAANKAVLDPAPPTTEELDRWSAAGVQSVQSGGITYYLGMDRMKAELVELERARHEAAIRDARNADATPPGLPYSLREAQEAGVSLAKARERTLGAFRDAPGVHAIPRPLYVRIRSNIENAATWSALVQYTAWGNLILVKHGAPDECEFCEYEEIHTYASPHVKRRKVSECWECRDSAAQPAALWTPARDSTWSIS